MQLNLIYSKHTFPLAASICLPLAPLFSLLSVLRSLESVFNT